MQYLLIFSLIDIIKLLLGGAGAILLLNYLMFTKTHHAGGIYVTKKHFANLLPQGLERSNASA